MEKQLSRYDDLDHWAQTRLALLNDFPPRPVPAIRSGRSRFLAEAQALQPITAQSKPGHHHTWIEMISSLFFRKLNSVSLTILSILIAISLLLSSGGTAVYASQGSMPDQFLYPVKLLTEDAQLMLASNPQSKALLNLEFVNRRIEEITQMAQNGSLPTAALVNRLQNELDEAFTNTDELATETKKVALENLRDNLVRHEEQLLKLQEQANPRAAAEFARLVAMLQLRLELAEKGIKNPEALHQLMQEQKAQIKEQFASPSKPEGSVTSEDAKGPKKAETSNDQPGKDKGPQWDKTPGPPPDNTTGQKDPNKIPPGQDKRDSGGNDDDKKGGKP